MHFVETATTHKVHVVHAPPYTNCGRAIPDTWTPRAEDSIVGRRVFWCWRCWQLNRDWMLSHGFPPADAPIGY